MSTAAEHLAGELEDRPPLARMAIAVLALVGLLVAVYLSMYKLGYLGIIQCQFGSCEKVQASRYAFFLGQPVAVWGVGAYIIIFALAMMGTQPRFARERWVALSIFAMSLVGVLFSAYLTYLEAAVIHAWCQWCVVSAILITLIFLLSIPGLRQAR
ncbi:vitamin K epoxide reductase family protein [Longimicrobium terrae]|uniref:Putative membrane protein n=1 Tax=Longimicrobium terrae TaxID=1639882 RepID=A0A841GXN4_9BACT|nr:vitamin K epoxide reductase family protein [Longimicrobium terrae]MBB4636114.1 putative membrane protein [Longimicrobium terrae]MBB6070509.1 putative membrane protein [Longimicrobium terrae]NNC29499.1 vitamin K epoxide reductase family protein [Longimicrobium terrae]